jgi:hypothetical protein
MTAVTITATRDLQRLAKRARAAQAKADEARSELERAAVEVRLQGATLARIGELIGMSAPGVLQMLRRHNAG